jgi:CDP-diacylglycerol--serine O-phosphatidyltransferase
MHINDFRSTEMDTSIKKRAEIWQHIPNLITLLSLCSGFISILFVFYRNLEYAALFIIIAALFDFFDGFAARTLKAVSEKGKVLDSLSDVISFGAAPATIIFLLIQYSLGQSGSGLQLSNLSFTDRIFLFSSVIFLLAAALRLAAFTVQDNTYVFNGLPAPPASLLIAGLAFIVADPGDNKISEWILKLYLIIPLVLLISLLMVSKIHFISFKFRNFGFRQNLLQYLLIIISIILLIFLKKFAISLIILIYIVVSIVDHFFKKQSDI